MIIDISKNNIVTNWCNVKSQAEGAIIRVGYRGYGNGKIVEDKLFKSHLKGCISHEIPVGLYFMSQAITELEAVEEAEYCVNYAKEYGAPLGIFIDSEDGDGTDRVVRADGLSKSARTKITVAFCEAVRAYGFEAGVYASESWFNSRLDYNAVKNYKIWVADYGKNTGVVCSTIQLPKYELHQYTSRGTVEGIQGNVDMSYIHNTVSTENPYPVPTRTLKLCDLLLHGNDVKWLQTELANRGYLPADEIDGWFGTLTEAATIAFQKDAGLVVDGIAGKNTINALRG